jgi:NAD-dependent DNA ligase
MSKQTLLERMAQMQRQLLTHACLYYTYNAPYWSDAQYDAVARELWDAQKKHPELVPKTPFPDVFADWGKEGTFCGSLHEHCKHPYGMAKARLFLPHSKGGFRPDETLQPPKGTR